MVKNLSVNLIAVLAAKRPNVSRRPYGALAEGEGSTTIPVSGFGNIPVGIIK